MTTGLNYTEPIKLVKYETTTDEAGGQIASNEMCVIDKLNANVLEKSYQRTDQNGKLVFQNAFKIEFWNNPSLIFDPSFIVVYRCKNLIIQNINLDDKRHKYTLNCVADGK
jgi:hypothetical protein